MISVIGDAIGWFLCGLGGKSNFIQSLRMQPIDSYIEPRKYPKNSPRINCRSIVSQSSNTRVYPYFIESDFQPNVNTHIHTPRKRECWHVFELIRFDSIPFEIPGFMNADKLFRWMEIDILEWHSNKYKLIFVEFRLPAEFSYVYSTGYINLI